jgi:hypothetical protein
MAATGTASSASGRRWADHGRPVSGSDDPALPDGFSGARGRSAMSTSWLDQSGHSIESHVAPEPDRMGSVSRGGFGKRRGAV